ncbi:hypothetical protein D3C71_1445570 [compost metagenome]
MRIRDAAPPVVDLQGDGAPPPARRHQHRPPLPILDGVRHQVLDNGAEQMGIGPDLPIARPDTDRRPRPMRGGVARVPRHRVQHVAQTHRFGLGHQLPAIQRVAVEDRTEQMRHTIQ